MANVLIWGASGGIGQALVRLFKQEGWRVFAAARDTTCIPDQADFTYRFDVAAPGTLSGWRKQRSESINQSMLISHCEGRTNDDHSRK